ncbi:peroxiredoxin-like family protein [Halofilum ochraceum]|uniref:peroxiredoxin-like family protein n=1 Tax=Halofilum ochraceum TaxID=1611323 RepID=UPI000836966B|nr:peroxiredoxin-like family protein [Halofilum ochraceum]
MILSEHTRATKERFLAQTDAETVELIGSGLEDLAASHPAGRALGPGTRAPDFERPDVRGGSVRLSRWLESGPVVLSFYRGGWCPFCSLELRAWAEQAGALHDAGAALIAISPEAADRAAASGTDWDPPFAVLTDADHGVAGAYGLTFELSSAARTAQRRLDAPLDRLNADGTWRLPVPATYVIAPNGVIHWAYVNDDYTERAEPEAVVAAVETLIAKRNGQAET